MSYTNNFNVNAYIIYYKNRVFRAGFLKGNLDTLMTMQTDTIRNRIVLSSSFWHSISFQFSEIIMIDRFDISSKDLNPRSNIHGFLFSGYLIGVGTGGLDYIS